MAMDIRITAIPIITDLGGIRIASLDTGRTGRRKHPIDTRTMGDRLRARRKMPSEASANVLRRGTARPGGQRQTPTRERAAFRRMNPLGGRRASRPAPIGDM